MCKLIFRHVYKKQLTFLNVSLNVNFNAVLKHAVTTNIIIMGYSRKASGDLTYDLTVLSRDFVVKITVRFLCEATTSKSVQFTTDPAYF